MSSNGAWPSLFQIPTADAPINNATTGSVESSNPCDALLLDEPFDLPMHIAAVFILLASSLVATMIPVRAAVMFAFIQL